MTEPSIPETRTVRPLDGRTGAPVDTPPPKEAREGVCAPVSRPELPLGPLAISHSKSASEAYSHSIDRMQRGARP
ncbi:hypothetical protein SAMN05421870_107295 [Streptomyces qinglanensis]|uniref:Uncharacterized protein n=1 Tax=Streptomyces qinglanensis TaxID=943816 RepID=A0A1H9U4B7_9ACTN|nr:hypothetical protein SAMN05421870_107295 [Streptomyces qinglanensis]